MAISLILASASPRRAQILEQCGLSFDVVPSGAEELHDEKESTEQLVLKNAQLKIGVIAKSHPEALVLAADTLVESGGKLWGKPENREEAMAMLECYRKHPIVVYTALAVCHQGKEASGIERTVLHLRPSGYEDYRRWVLAHKHFEYFADKAGGFTIEGLGGVVFDCLEGSFYNVLGMPIHLFYDLVKQLNLSLFELLD